MNVNYDNLVRDYLDGLFNRLRNFTAGPEFLATWVHDQDHARSLFGLFEAAETAKLPMLQVVVGNKTASEIDIENLRKELSPLGIVEIQKQGEAILLTMRFSHA